MDIPDKIDFGQLQKLADDATTGISAVDADEMLVMCDDYIEQLDLMIDKIDACVTSSIHHDRWRFFERARRSLKIARRNFKSAVRT